MTSSAADKRTSGAPFSPPPAEVWNNMVAAGQAFADARLGQASPLPSRPRSTDVIRCKNESGATRVAGEILKISGIAATNLTKEHPWVTGGAPTAIDPFGILTHNVADNDFTGLQVSGVCVARVNIVNTAHTHARPLANDYVLESGLYGPVEILWAPSSTGEADCLVCIKGWQPIGFIVLTPSGGIPGRTGNVDGSATCTVQTSVLGTRSNRQDDTPADMTMTVYHNGSTAVKGSLPIQLKIIDGLPYADAEDCG